MSEIKTIDQLRLRYEELFRILEAVSEESWCARNGLGDRLSLRQITWVTFDRPLGDATPLIEEWNGIFYFVISERGTELRRTIGDANEVLRLLFNSITFSLASNFEVSNRVEGQDPRRLLFSKQVELLRLLSDNWASVLEAEHVRVLKGYPFKP